MFVNKTNYLYIHIFVIGNSNKSIGKHLLNDYSSRSHCILTLNIYSVNKENKSKLSIRQGKIHFVDLAGKFFFFFFY